MNLRRYLLVITIMAACIQGAVSQERPQPPKKRFGSRGCIELGGTLGYSNISQVNGGKSLGRTTILSAGPSAGYFVFDGLEAGIDPAGVVYTKSGGESLTELRSFGFVAYHLQTGMPAVPYVAGLGGYGAAIASSGFSPTGIESTRQGICWGGRAGVKVAVAEHANLVIGLQYIQTTLNSSGASSRSGTDEFSVAVGWTIWL
jgi:hypothetical protein